MSHRLVLALALVGMVGVSSTYAQAASLHTGKPTVGTVVSLADHGLTLQTDTGATPVTFQDKTTFERGDAQASPAEIKKGDQLTVFGTKLPTGEVVAREVLLPTPDTKGEAHPRHTDHRVEER